MLTHSLKIQVTFSDVLAAVTAESAWRHALDPSEPTLTSDQAPLIGRKVKQAYNDLCARLAGYLEINSFNPNANDQFVVLWLRLRQRPSSRLEGVMKGVIVDAFAQFALAAFYGRRDKTGEQSVYHLAWQRACAHIAVLLARDANGLPLLP